jgi:hypothetical protein
VLAEQREFLQKLLKPPLGPQYDPCREGWNAAIYTVLAKNFKLAPAGPPPEVPRVVSAAGEPARAPQGQVTLEQEAREMFRGPYGDTVPAPGEHPWIDQAVERIATALRRQR